MGIGIPIILFVLGLIIIIKGGDIFVESAVWVAKVTGIPNIIIGATIVSLATTLPELFVSMIASTSGSPDIAIGNAVGSMICNIGLILAISFIFMPSIIKRNTFQSKAYIMILASLFMLIFSLDKVIKPYEGLGLLLILLYYIYINVKEAKNSIGISENEIAAAVESSRIKVKVSNEEIIKNIALFIIGAVLIVIGAKLLVGNAQRIALYFSIPEAIISLTVVALGTSLPELVTAITAIVKKEDGVAVGNILGANILNITMILGSCSLFSKEGLIVNSRDITVFSNTFNNVPQTLYLDMPIAVVLMLLVVIPIIKNGRSKRSNGFMLLTIYSIYILSLITMVV